MTFLDITDINEDGRKEVIAAAPVVERIVPDGCWVLGQSVETEERTWSEGVNSLTGFRFTINAGIQYQHHEAGEKTDKATVTGTISLDNSRRKGPGVPEKIKNSRKNNVVIWNLLENRSTKQGIPTLLQGAVLLKRDPDKPESIFKAHVKIKVVVDWETGFRRSITHQTPEDKLLTFHPGLEPETRIKGFVKTRLDEADLSALQNVVETLPMGQPRTPTPTPTTVHSKSEPCTPTHDSRGKVYETTNVTVSGGGYDDQGVRSGGHRVGVVARAVDVKESNRCSAACCLSRGDFLGTCIYQLVRVSLLGGEVLRTECMNDHRTFNI